MTFDGFIQIAGVIDRTEADLLLECGVRHLGFPLRLPVNEEDLTEAEAARIIAHLPAGAHATAITYLDRAVDVERFCRELGTTVVHDDNLPALEETVSALSPHVDAFITDTYDPRTGASGATGTTHDWRVSRRLVEISPRPLILAGGLTPQNVKEAIEAVGPAGVDVHTGVEGPDGRKDPRLVRAFVRAARETLRAG